MLLVHYIDTYDVSPYCIRVIFYIAGAGVESEKLHSLAESSLAEYLLCSKHMVPFASSSCAQKVS